MPLTLKGPESVEDLGGHHRRETERGFVDEKESRTPEDRAGDGQHLLLAARQGAGRAAGEVAEDRKQFVDGIEVAVDLVAPLRCPGE